jgi:hypothetical protein
MNTPPDYENQVADEMVHEDQPLGAQAAPG